MFFFKYNAWESRGNVLSIFPAAGQGGRIHYESGTEREAGRRLRHDTRKINSFIRHAEAYREDAPYAEIINSFAEAGGWKLDPEELKYCIELIPMAQKRGSEKRRAEAAEAAADGRE